MKEIQEEITDLFKICDERKNHARQAQSIMDDICDLLDESTLSDVAAEMVMLTSHLQKIAELEEHLLPFRGRLVKLPARGAKK